MNKLDYNRNIYLLTAFRFFHISHNAMRTVLKYEYTDEERATLGSTNSILVNIVEACTIMLIGVLSDIIGITYVLIIITTVKLFILVPLSKFYFNKLYKEYDFNEFA